MDNNVSLLSTAPFSSIYQWDVKQFFFKKLKSKYPVEKLGKHLVHQTTKVQLSDTPNEEFTILGVSNKIGMFDASREQGKKIKQKYHIVKDNWIAYNPYRINVGSIGIKTPDLQGSYISPAYVVFSCKDTLIPEFLWLMMKTSYFNKLIKDSTTGSVRQTLHFEKLAEIEAPIPSIPEQKEILRAYHDMLYGSEKNKEDGDNFGSSLLSDIQQKVSNLTNENEKSSNASSVLKTVSFTSTNRWEVAYILKEGQLESIYNSFKFPSYCISQLQTESLFGLSLKASSTQKSGMIPMLRMPNIVNGEIDCTELKYLPRKSTGSVKEPQKWLLQKGDFLINRTNSKELVGKAAIFNLDGEYTYASYVIRYRFDTNLVLPEYINIMFMLPLVRKQIDAVSRQTAGQCNINSDEIGAIRIPVPSLPEQQNIIDYYNSTKNGADVFYLKAQELKEIAQTNFENCIFSK